MEDKSQFSIFDGDVNPAQIGRSTLRRKAMIMPTKKGQEWAAQIQREMTVPNT
jgi:hypothetical protein